MTKHIGLSIEYRPAYVNGTCHSTTVRDRLFKLGNALELNIGEHQLLFRDTDLDTIGDEPEVVEANSEGLKWVSKNERYLVHIDAITKLEDDEEDVDGGVIEALLEKARGLVIDSPVAPTFVHMAAYILEDGDPVLPKIPTGFKKMGNELYTNRVAA